MSFLDLSLGLKIVSATIQDILAKNVAESSATVRDSYHSQVKL
jgi:hypothetical protein